MSKRNIFRGMTESGNWIYGRPRKYLDNVIIVPSDIEKFNIKDYSQESINSMIIIKKTLGKSLGIIDKKGMTLYDRDVISYREFGEYSGGALIHRIVHYDSGLSKLNIATEKIIKDRNKRWSANYPLDASGFEIIYSDYDMYKKVPKYDAKKYSYGEIKSLNNKIQTYDYNNRVPKELDEIKLIEMIFTRIDFGNGFRDRGFNLNRYKKSASIFSAMRDNKYYLLDYYQRMIILDDLLKLIRDKEIISYYEFIRLNVNTNPFI